MLQTPSKNFRHCSLRSVMWRVLWDLKSKSGIFLWARVPMSPILNFWWDVWICSQGPYRDINSSQHYFVYRRNFNCLHTGVYRVHYFIIFWGDRGFWLFDVAGLVMYWINTIRRIVTKSLYRTAVRQSTAQLPCYQKCPMVFRPSPFLPVTWDRPVTMGLGIRTVYTRTLFIQ